ncbi:hypothetical protein Mth01_13430 [Sphaerimonospora thailandensis]|uniref:histidine kinase n=1 Tax=Sphaerimonospora thailandensis TaxID=795644 RepID=A0A8J3R764_9ACTN|nr:hypothetical protein Mth01_13430 [Sphaerimonospora thailandensis]
MAGRKRSIRFKITAILLVPTIALVMTWGFAATLTIRQGVELLRIQTVFTNVVQPMAGVILQLQRERLLTAECLNSPAPLKSELDKERKVTDEAVAELARSSSSVKDDTPPAMWNRVQELVNRARKLDGLRDRVDRHTLHSLDAIEEYTAVADIGFLAYDYLMISADIDMIEQTRAIVLIVRGHELVSQQSALLTGVQTAGRITQDERDAFAAMVSKRRLLYSLGTGQLDAELLQPFTDLNTSALYSSFTSIEDQIVKRIKPDKPLPSSAQSWPTVAEGLSKKFEELTLGVGMTLTARAAPRAQGILISIAVIGVAGLLAILATAFVSLRFARRITGELTGLQHAATELADLRLPRIINRLRRGEDVDVAAETPPALKTAETVEVESVNNAFTSVQLTAIESAVHEAELRKGVNKVFLNLARRNQSLLQRQLGMLDGLEREVADHEVLEKLFGIDHLTTRMRRHAEGLIILSGAAPARGWRDPVNLFDVVRAAIEEVEDYLRIDVIVPHGHALVGSAVTDIIHLLAELIENAAIFSPPHTRVQVRGEMVARGFALEIEDRGLGLAPEELARINELLANAPEFDLADSDRLGLFVVARLAHRHNVRVSLRPSPYGGTSAIVLVPQELVVETEARDLSVERIAAPHPAPALSLTPPAADTAAADPRGRGDLGNRDGDGDELPRRVRQANLAPQLRDERADLFSSFQAGWQRAQEDDL